VTTERLSNEENEMAQKIDDDRVISAYCHAAASVQEAEQILVKGMPHRPSELDKLADAAKNLTAYLAELER
jgi:hypothetical protein